MKDSDSIGGTNVVRALAPAVPALLPTRLATNVETSLDAAGTSARATSWFRKLSQQVAVLALTALLGGFLTALLVRNSPGFDADERLLDPRLDAASLAAIRNEHAKNHDLLRVYWRQISNAVHGDFGVSPSLNQPIRQLISARLPVTAGLMGFGLVIAWALALAAAIVSVQSRHAIFGKLAGASSTMALCLPSAVVAILIFSLGGPVRLAIPLVLFPRLFETARNLLRDAFSQPHIVTARAKGVGPLRILFFHAMPACAPELLAFAGISVIMAFGIAIPVETLCDVPGLGQLAWKAAIARDLPLLVTLTLLIAIGSQVINAACDWLSFGMERKAA